MASQDLNRSIKITIDGTDAAKAVDKLEKEINDLTAQLNALNKTEADYDKRSKELSDRLGKKNKTLETYKKKVSETDRVLKNLSGATYDELLAVKRQLQKSLQNEVRGTEKYNETLRQYKRVTEEATKAQKDMRVEVGCQGTTFGKVANFLNKYATLITSTLAGITGLSVAMRKSVNDYAKMQEAMAGVKKYTGLADDEIKDLNEDLKKMDTRTSREKLNALAGDAGRLGIQSKEAILEFVEAADKINVALGEDLGEDAVKNIGKLAQMFGEDERLGLRGAMLATGSAINEVAQNSAAAEPFLVDFAARVAGAANQAGISQDKIIGFAAAMDENMLREETSATAYQKILLKLFTDTEKFAEAAGLNVQEFAALVRTDANEALLQFAEALGQKGGLADLAPIFGDLKTEGAGVSTVLSVLAGKADEIREHQAMANKAYAEGISIQKEFEVQNNTVQAGLDKAKKGFHEVSIALGEKLQPLMKHFISGTSLLVRGLNALINVVVEFHRELLSAAIGLATYTVAVNAVTIAKKAMELATKAATIATNLFNKALKLSPWGLLISGVTAAISYFAIFKTRTDEQTASQRALNDELSETQQRLKRLESIDLRSKNLDTLNDRQKQQLKTDAQNELNAIEDRLSTEVALFRKYYDEQKNIIQSRTDIDIAQKRALIRNLDIQADEKAKELEGLINKQQELQALIAKIPDAKPIVITPTTTTPSPSGGEESTGKGETPTEKALREEKELHQRYLYELKQEYANQEGEILMTKEEYADAQEQLVMMHLQRSLDIVGLDAQQKMDIEQQLLDFKIKCAEEELAIRKKKSDEEAKIEEQNRKQLENIGRKRYQTMMGYAETFSSGIANAIANEQNVLEAFGDSMVDIVFDVVEQLIDAELIRLTGIGLSTIAEVQARQIGSKGFAGVASGLALSAVISASLAAAKAGLKALLKGGKKSSDGGTDAKSYKRVATGVNQYASGKYDVIGGSDGRLYSGVPYIGAAPTGIVRSPALISEHGAELIINAEDLARLQQHVNYPLVLQAIADSRRGTAVPQHEAGSYPVPVSPSRETTGSAVSMDTFRRLAEAIEYLNENGVAATTVLSEFEKKQALRDRARKIGSKKR